MGTSWFCSRFIKPMWLQGSGAKLNSLIVNDILVLVVTNALLCASWGKEKHLCCLPKGMRIQQGLVSQYLCCSLGVCCPLAPSSEEPRDSVKNIIYSVSFPTIGISAPAEAVADSAEWESQARASGKPEVFEWPASEWCEGEWFQFLHCCFWTEPSILCYFFHAFYKALRMSDTPYPPYSVISLSVVPISLALQLFRNYYSERIRGGRVKSSAFQTDRSHLWTISVSAAVQHFQRQWFPCAEAGPCRAYTGRTPACRWQHSWQVWSTACSAAPRGATMCLLWGLLKESWDCSFLSHCNKENFPSSPTFSKKEVRPLKLLPLNMERDHSPEGQRKSLGGRSSYGSAFHEGELWVKGFGGIV